MYFSEPILLTLAGEYNQTSDQAYSSQKCINSVYLNWQKSVYIVININFLTMLNLNPQNNFVKRSNHSQLFIRDFQPLDLQYEICSNFMKKASEQIYLKELELINSTTKFFEFVQDSLAQKDISTTQQSLTLESCFDEDDTFSQPTKSRLLLRKSKSNVSIRRTQSGLNQALREVQKCCTQKTSSLVSSIAGQFRRVKEKLSSLQKNLKEFKKLQQRFESVQEQLFIAKKRVSDLEKQNETYQDDLRNLKRKLKDMKDEGKSTTLALSRSSDNLKMLTKNSAMDKMKRFLEEKQFNIAKKQKDVKGIQDKIQQSLQKVAGEATCDKCCLMLKKIRESIMKYRTLLEEEASAADTFYSNYKRQFC